MNLQPYHQNFIKAIKLLMAERPDLGNTKEVAAFLGMNYLALYKVITGENRPTTELCIKICEKAGVSANWLFLNKAPVTLEELPTLKKISSQLNRIEKKLNV